MTDVSVIMPAYNATATIVRAIDSALGQSFGSLEVIVADDRSSDGTPALVRDHYAGDPRVRVIEMARNGGPSAARNAAIGVATGDWIALLDADDAWRPDRLDVMLKEQDVDLIADQVIGYDAAADTETGPWFRRPLSGDVDLVRLLRTGFGFDFGFLKPLMRRSFLAEAGITYPEALRHGEDLVTYARCLAARGRMRVLPYAGYVYTTPRGRASGEQSPHSHTRPDKQALATALEAIAEDYAPSLTPAERAAFAWRAEFYRTRIAFDRFVEAMRSRDPVATAAALAVAPIAVGRHLGQELWVRFG